MNQKKVKSNISSKCKCSNEVEIHKKGKKKNGNCPILMSLKSIKKLKLYIYDKIKDFILLYMILIE